jgi:transcriptional regulator with XRE-family HTH domain
VTSTAAEQWVGALLRDWRNRRRLSQLELALEADISARHLSFVETGRSRPSPEMILRLAEQLDVPLRDRNALMLAGGYAPVYPEHPLEDDELEPVRDALQLVLAGHEPYPAVVVDRGWNLVAANRSVDLLTEGIAAHLLEPPANVLRATLHPEGMAPRIVNLGEWRTHLLDRLERQVERTGDATLADLLAELRGYPGPARESASPRHFRGRAREIVAPIRLRLGERELAFFGTVAVFGTPLDVTVAELAIEAFFPADPETAQTVRELYAAIGT